MDATTILLEVFHDPRLMDPRRTQGLRHPLPGILALTTVLATSPSRPIHRAARSRWYLPVGSLNRGDSATGA